MKSILLLLSFLTAFILTDHGIKLNGTNPKLEKRITKQISRIWPDRTIVIDTCTDKLDERCQSNGLTFVIRSELLFGDQNYDTLGYIYENRVFSCRQGGCTMTSGNEDGSLELISEFFDYYTILDKELKILKVDVYNYQATHGQEVCSKGWLKQFIGYSGSEELIYGIDIQAISGATISASSITYDIQERVNCLSRSIKM